MVRLALMCVFLCGELLAASSVAADVSSSSKVPSIATAWSGPVPISYRVYGAGELAIILVHGWACDSSSWDAQTATLSERYTVVTLDLGGHGQSGRNRSDWSMRSFGVDVVAVAQRVPARRIVLVGHSMGGAVVVEAARHLRERLVGVIGVDTFHHIGAPLPDAADISARVQPFRTDFAGTTRKLAEGAYFTAAIDPTLRQRIVERMAATPPEVAIEAMVQLMQMDYGRALADVAAPIVAVNSDRRAMDLDTVRQVVPGFEVRWMKGAGHFLMLEAAPQFNEILQRVLLEWERARAQ